MNYSIEFQIKLKIHTYVSVFYILYYALDHYISEHETSSSEIFVQRNKRQTKKLTQSEHLFLLILFANDTHHAFNIQIYITSLHHISIEQ